MSHVDDGALHAYLDGELSPVERTQLEAHVAECVACRTRLDEARVLIERASGLLGQAQPPERAMPPLHQLRRPRLTWRLRVPIAWAASVVLALGLGYYIGGESLEQAASLAAAHLEDSMASGTGPVAERDRLTAPTTPPPTAAKARAPERRSTNQVAARTDAPADSAARVVLDTARAAAGVVAIQPREALREATPAPVPSAAVVTSRAEAEVSEERGRLMATQWQIIRPGPARDLLGADPVGIPGLAVRNMRRSPTGDVVLVEQVVDSSTVIQLFQRRLEVERSLGRLQRSAEPAAGAQLQEYVRTERLARFVGGLRVEIAGPLSTDSLNRLLEQVKPIKP
jgi:putative zinc finger protein